MATENNTSGGHAPNKTWKEMYPTNFLKGEDVPAKGLKILIRAIDTQKMRASASKPETEEYVLRFDIIAGAVKKLDVKRNESGYGLVLNRTRCAEIDAIVGDGTGLVRSWLGKQIVIFTRDQKVQGEMQKVIHARAPEVVKPDDRPSETSKMPQSAAVAPTTQLPASQNGVIEKTKPAAEAATP
jgi:hypothetical protein